MGYLDTLKDIEAKISESKELGISHKSVVIDLIEKERTYTNISSNPFSYFYKDVTQATDIFDFESVLVTTGYDASTSEALSCTRIFSSFQRLEPNSKLLNWLHSAIKFTDNIVLHYLQDVLNEEPTKQGDAGKERSRYIQINRQGSRTQKAGRIMDNLYEVRNKMEHRTVNDSSRPGYQKIIPPNYKKSIKQITKRYPEALLNFDTAFKEHYN